MTPGLLIFETVAAAIAAGYMILSPIPDGEGFLHARTMTARGWAVALVKVSK